MQRTLQSVGLGGYYYEIRRNFYSNLIEVEDIPYLTPHKNTADIKLVVEALSVGYQNEYITHFAVLASDRDYVPLYQKLRALNKTVITIGVDQMHMNSMVREASDRLFYYEHLFLGDTVSALYETEEGNYSPLRNEYFELLTRSMKKLERENIVLDANALLRSMSNARSDFDFALIGCKSFSHFLRLATESGCIEENQQNHTFKLASAEALPHDPEENVPDMATEADVRKEAKIYRDLLGCVLKISFPGVQVRESILRAIREALDRKFGVTIHEALSNRASQAGDNLTLNSIADIVCFNMQEKGLEVNRVVVYKIIFGLHIARCFYEYRKEVSDIASLQVTGIAKPYDVWEEELYKIYIGQIRNNIRSRPVRDAALAQLLYENVEDETIKKIEYLRSG
jgi:hypothetical protein